MYRVDYYDTSTGRLSKPIFNSIDAAHKFVKELLNREDVQEYIRHLRNSKKVYGMNYAVPETQLNAIYGDVDQEFPALSTFRLVVHRCGMYEYRIGSSGINSRSIYFKTASISVDDIRKSVDTDQPDKLNDASIKINQLFSNDYSRPYHE
jgi:hypothetical protein